MSVKRLSANPFQKLPKFDEDSDRRQPRRALTMDELGRLMEAARNAPGRPKLKDAGKDSRPAQRLSGAGRADLYAILAGTGLRMEETRLLLVSDLYLDAIVPGIDLRPEVTKSRRAEFIPLHPGLIDIIRKQIAGRKPAARAFEVPADLIKRFHADCKRAGIPRFDERGYRVVLHSHRKTFGTELARAGVPLATSQKLMRHSDPKLTSNIYTDLKNLDLLTAVSSMPSVVAKVVVTERTPLQISATDVHSLQDETKEKAAS